jgi:hypothetical protein
MGTATVVMILHGLGWSLRRRSVVPQCLATKAVEREFGPGLSAEDLKQ